MTKKKITIDDLAIMVQKGFNETASKTDMNVRFEVIDARFDAVDARFDKVDERLDRIENILIRAHDDRLDRLEDSVRILKTKAGIR